MLNNFKWYRALCGGIWYKIKYQMPYGKVYTNGKYLDKELSTIITWDRSDTKRGFGIFEILKTEDYRNS